MLEAVYTSKFKRDFKLCIKQGKDMRVLKEIMTILENDEEPSPEYNDHPMRGQFAGTRECHLEGPHSDWILIYEKRSQEVIAYIRTGSHANL